MMQSKKIVINYDFEDDDDDDYDFGIDDEDEEIFGQEGFKFDMDNELEPWEGDQEEDQAQAAKKEKKSGFAGGVKARRTIPVLAVIGRPNVGKSTIVNRITAQHKAGSIIHDEAGVTRDRTYKRAFFGEYNFEVVDTGGLVFDDNPDDIFAKDILAQAMIAMEEASAILFVVDGQIGMTNLDEQIARFLRRQKTPAYVMVNKCESIVNGQIQAAEFWSLGLGEPFPVSGIHGNGVAEVLELACSHMEVIEDINAIDDNTYNVAIIGRPNVGKSSMLNRILGEERAIVSDIAGTTRDTIDALVEKNDRYYRFIDTAGIRKKKKIKYGNEFFMINRALKAIRRSDVTLLVLDAVDGIHEQDRILAERIKEDGRGCVILLNKWDAVEKDEKTYIKTVEYLRNELPPVSWADVILTSAKTGQRCHKIYEAVDKAVKQHRMRIRTSVLNEVLRESVLWQPPPTKSNAQQGKIYYCNQVATAPPTIAIFCNNPKLFPDSYRRYLERKFREQLGFESTPIRFLWRGKQLRRLMQEQNRVIPGSKGGKPYASPF
mmetsp:Transcript_4688/g.6157  ORF Transcript_4688/g.6157 Transcript_4688/m.6157 type:complete len:546 (-) Transcript_4688:229-1866(-)